MLKDPSDTHMKSLRASLVVILVNVSDNEGLGCEPVIWWKKNQNWSPWSTVSRVIAVISLLSYYVISDKFRFCSDYFGLWPLNTFKAGIEIVFMVTIWLLIKVFPPKTCRWDFEKNFYAPFILRLHELNSSHFCVSCVFSAADLILYYEVPERFKLKYKSHKSCGFKQ